MLRIVYPICCGIDVHKNFIVACIASTNDKGVTTYQSSRFSTFTSGLRKLCQWLCFNSCTHACMESTGKYWIPVYNILERYLPSYTGSPKVHQGYSLQEDLTKRMPDGLRIFSSTILLPQALCRHFVFVNCVI